MDVTNIAMVLAPNLFCSLPAGKLGCDDITLAAKTSHVVLLLIRYHYILWAVSILDGWMDRWNMIQYPIRIKLITFS
jgi:hypothetical protein